MKLFGKDVILFQPGATSVGFQFGGYYFYINKPRFWIVKPNPPIRNSYQFHFWSGIKHERDLP